METSKSSMANMQKYGIITPNEYVAIFNLLAQYMDGICSETSLILADCKSKQLMQDEYMLIVLGQHTRIFKYIRVNPAQPTVLQLPVNHEELAGSLGLPDKQAR